MRDVCTHVHRTQAQSRVNTTRVYDVHNNNTDCFAYSQSINHNPVSCSHRQYYYYILYVLFCAVYYNILL